MWEKEQLYIWTKSRVNNNYRFFSLSTNYNISVVEDFRVLLIELFVQVNVQKNFREMSTCPAWKTLIKKPKSYTSQYLTTTKPFFVFMLGWAR